MADENTAVVKSAKRDIETLLGDKKVSIQELLPTHVDVDKFIKSTLMAVARDPKLQRCTATSVFTAAMNAAELGLLFTPALRHAYLVPFGDEAKFLPGYGGLVHLAVNSGVATKMETRKVFEKDMFQITYGTNPQIIHVPYLGDDPGKLVGTYAIAWFKDGGTQFEFCNMIELEKIMKSSKAKDGTAWTNWRDEMHRKGPLKRLCKYLPASADDRLFRAIDYDNAVTGYVEEQPSGDDGKTKTQRIAELLTAGGYESGAIGETKEESSASEPDPVEQGKDTAKRGVGRPPVAKTNPNANAEPKPVESPVSKPQDDLPELPEDDGLFPSDMKV